MKMDPKKKADIAGAAFGLIFGLAGLAVLNFYVAWRKKQLKAWVRSLF